MANVGILGYGIVGKATAHSLREKNTIIWHDKYKTTDGTEHSQPLEEVIEESEFLFVCLPTETNFTQRHIDLSLMDENIETITQHTNNMDKILIIKSTVTPQTTLRYARTYPQTHFVFSPEFLTEANYLQDALHPDRLIVGATNDHISLRVTELYRNSFPTTKLHRTDPTSAEMVKYMANSFLALKVSFANQMYALCEELAIKYEEVARMVTDDTRIGPSHLDVTTMRGYGGKCFPKDIVALIGLCNDLHLDHRLLTASWDYNLDTRRKGPDNKYDWETIPGVMSKHDNPL